MDADVILGCVLGVVALGLTTSLVLWSRRAIDRIARGDATTAREIVKDLRGE